MSKIVCDVRNSSVDVFCGEAGIPNGCRLSHSRGDLNKMVREVEENQAEKEKKETKRTKFMRGILMRGMALVLRGRGNPFRFPFQRKAAARLAGP